MSYEIEPIEPAAAEDMLDVEHLMLRHDARVQAAFDHARERGLEPSPSMLARVDALRERLLATLAKTKNKRREVDPVGMADAVSAPANYAAYDDLCALARDGALPHAESASQQSGCQSDHSIIDELLGLAPQKPQHGQDAADVDTDPDATALLDELFASSRPDARGGNDHEPG